MAEKLTNFADTHMIGGIDDNDLTITVNDGSRFPTDSFYAVLDSGTAAAEIIWVSTRSGNVFTISSTLDRGLKDTTAVAHRHGCSVVHSILAHHVENLSNAMGAYQIYLQENFK